MSVQLTKRRQLYTSCAIFALPLALASVTSAQAQSTSTVAVRTAAGATTSSTTANVVGTKPAVVAAATTSATTSTAATSTTATTTTAAASGTSSTGLTTTTASTSTAAASTAVPAKTTTTAVATSTVDVPGAYSNTSKFGNFLRPFSATSMWNARPINPKFDSFVIPTSDYYPVVGSGAFSAGVFESQPSDPAVTVYAPAGTKGVWNADAEEYTPSITIPHFPTATTPATGGDGHADIIDSATGVVHSFWQLKQVNGKWQANTYGWTKVTGTGWGDPAHYYQGARAAAVPPLAGLIRKHEIDDGADSYSHALAMSLTFSGLSAKPTYVFPATSADTYASSLNKGGIPEGALVMLPPDFDVSKLTSAKLRKVANTLKKYGAYVVDQNSGTPYYIYVENNSGYAMHGMPWNSVVAAELQTVRAALRMVTSAESWVDGDGKAMVPPTKMNLLSMRGPWTRWSGGTTLGKFNTWTQAVEFGPSTAVTTMVNGSSRGLGGVTWSKVAPGTPLKFTVKAQGGAKFRARVFNPDGTQFLDTNALGNGESARFIYPAGGWYVFYTLSGVGAFSSVRATLEQVAP